MYQSEMIWEDPQEVTSVAIRLYSKDQAHGDLDKYQETKARLTQLAASGTQIPAVYMERAAAAMKSEYEHKHTANRTRMNGVYIIMAGVALVMVGLMCYCLFGTGVLAQKPVVSHTQQTAHS